MQKLRCTGSPAHLSVAHEGPGPQAQWLLFSRRRADGSPAAKRCWMNTRKSESEGDRAGCWHTDGVPGASGRRDWAVRFHGGPQRKLGRQPRVWKDGKGQLSSFVPGRQGSRRQGNKLRYPLPPPFWRHRKEGCRLLEPSFFFFFFF